MQNDKDIPAISPMKATPARQGRIGRFMSVLSLSLPPYFCCKPSRPVSMMPSIQGKGDPWRGWLALRTKGRWRWLNYYFLCGVLMLLSLVGVVFYQTRQSMIIHSVVVLIFCSSVLCTTVRKKKQTAQHKPELDTNDQDGKMSPVVGTREQALVGVEEDKFRFSDRIPQYKADLERWMTEQKPYCDKNFKLLDVMQALPLNRTYLSRLFNEGYGEQFVNFVMRYRIAESMRLLSEFPDLPICKVSELAGFSSPSVFGRTFLKSKGVTPLQYRKGITPKV